MKKLGILLGGIGLTLCFVSCKDNKEQNNKVDHVSFTLNGTTYEFDTSMKGKKVYETLFMGSDTLIFRSNLKKSYQYTNLFEKKINNKNAYDGNKLIDQKETYTRDIILKNYSPSLKYTEEGEYEFLIEETVKETSTKTTEQELRFYGEHAILTADDEGYTRGDLDPHWVDRIYYTNKVDSTTKNVAYNKYYNSSFDYMQGAEKRLKLSDVNDKIYSSRSIFDFGIFILDSKLDSYVHYDYEFTEEDIILKYRVDFSIASIARINSSDSISNSELKSVEEEKKAGSYYFASVALNYKNILHSDGYDHLDHPHEIHVEDVRVQKESGTYDSSYAATIVGKNYSIHEVLKTVLSYQVLSLSTNEIDQLKKDIIQKANSKES